MFDRQRPLRPLGTFTDQPADPGADPTSQHRTERLALRHTHGFSYNVLKPQKMFDSSFSA